MTPDPLGGLSPQDSTPASGQASAPASTPARESWKRKLAKSPATWLLLAANVVVFAAAESNGSTLSGATLMRFGACERTAVWGGEPWRVFTSMFLHIGLVHLAMNTWAMFGWCEAVESRLGTRRFLLIYLLSGMAASAASVLGHDVISAGASGAGFAMIGAVLVLRYRLLGGLRVFAADPASRRTLVSIVIWTVLGGTVLHLDNFAHGGGLVAGVILTLALTTSTRAAAAATGLIALFVALAVAPPQRLRDSLVGGYLRFPSSSEAQRASPP